MVPSDGGGVDIDDNVDANDNNSDHDPGKKTTMERPNKAMERPNKIRSKYYKIGGPIIQRSRHTRPFLPIAAIPQSLDINQGPELKSKSSSSLQSICCFSKINHILLLILADE